MTEQSAVPRADIARVSDTTARFVETIGVLTDADVRRATPLTGWTVGHVLTHVARNADSHSRRADAASRGEIVDQYVGGYAGRADEIERGAHRTAIELIEDVRRSARQLQVIWEQVPEYAWASLTRGVAGMERPLEALPRSRWQELEVHLVDLGVGPTYREWSDDFIEAWLPLLRLSLQDRLPDGTAPPTDLDERDELSWLYGRLTRPDLPVLAPWG